MLRRGGEEVHVARPCQLRVVQRLLGDQPAETGTPPPRIDRDGAEERRAAVDLEPGNSDDRSPVFRYPEAVNPFREAGASQRASTVTYDRARCTVAVRVLPAERAIDEEARLIVRLRPRDNLVGQPEELGADEAVPF